MPGLIKDKALGLIETVGLVGAIEATDAAAKAADVVINAAEIVDPALVTIKIFGELGAVQAAVEAGSRAAAKIGQLLASHIIPNPDDGLDIIMGDMSEPYDGSQPRKKAIKAAGVARPSARSKPSRANQYPGFADIEKMRVTELRALARTIPNLAIKGREISRADRDTLLKEIKKILNL